jgi:kumamolisin
LKYSLARACAITLAVTVSLILRSTAYASDNVRLKGQISAIPSSATLQGRVSATAPVSFAISLPLRNADELETLIGRLHDPADPLYGHYLTPEEFTERFGPTEGDYNAVKAYAIASGFTVTGEHANRTILDVQGPSASVERSFGVRLLQYRAVSGRLFHRADAEPSVPSEIANRIRGIIGLDTYPQMRPYAKQAPGWGNASTVRPRATTLGGSGPLGTFSPSDIATAYGIPHDASAGSGQTLAVFELDGYNTSDITAFQTFFGLPAVPVENVLIDGATGSIGSTGGGGEVTLDLEIMLGLVPGATKIICYEAPNGTKGILDCYNQIATENRAKMISTSWGRCETETAPSSISAEAAIFQQMAAQGQTLVAAAGDSGAYDDYDSSTPTAATISVDNPASQPYVLSVGGTRLTTSSAGGSYSTETTWNNGSPGEGAGGGGISKIWSIPSWQKSAVTTTAGASSTMRNVPDVCVNADPETPYGVYYQGAWTGFGGTSAGSPVWSSFLAIANQQRLAVGGTTVGNAAALLYSIGASSVYTKGFHDIADGSTNLHFAAVTGFDLATGLGSMKGTALLSYLAPNAVLNDTPKITGLSVASATAGDPPFTMTVTGTGFEYGATVTLGTTALATSFVSSTSLTAVVSAAAVAKDGSFPVTVTNPASGGVASNAITFVVAQAAAPIISTITPVSATAGKPAFTMTVTGAGFISGATLALGTTTVSTNVISSTRLTATIPASATRTVGGYYVTVTNPSSGGVSSNALTFIVVAPAALHTFGTGLQMISSPIDATGYTLSQIFGVSTVKLATWDAAAAEYVVSPASPADTFRPGRGYWARLTSNTTLIDMGSALATSTPVALTLQAGWNLAGNPRTAALSARTLAVALNSGATLSVGAAGTAGILDTVIYAYQPGDTGYEVIPISTGTIPAYAGFWLYSSSPCTLLFP